MPALALAAAITIQSALTSWAGPPPAEPAPTVISQPPKGRNGTALLAVGGTVKALSLGAGITGLVLGGSPGLLMSTWSVAPSALSGGVLLTGVWLRARHRAWYDERDLLGRARTARRVGWPLFGVGLGLLAGTSVALALWPLEACYDDGCALVHPRAFVSVASVFLVAPLLIDAGAGALVWSTTYGRARALRLELTPTLGGLSMRF